jgi:uncharacterized protein YfaS (alpha-2-macroglobulin family)
MATRYRVEVQAGTRSAIGGVLAAGRSWTFATPPPRIERAFPSGVTRGTSTLMAILFDQRIDPAAVLAAIRVESGDERFPVELVGEEMAKADEAIRTFLGDALEERRVVFRCRQPLPTDVRVRVVLPKGTPSLEGPRRTEKPHQFSFRTYAPLRVTRHRCGRSQEECRPRWAFHIELNNPLATPLDVTSLRVEPPIADLQATASGSRLSLKGQTAARTSYRVTLPASLRDQYGQTLGQDRTLTFEVGPARPQLSAPRQGFVILDPAARGRFSLFSVNYEQLRVQVFRVSPDDWPRFHEVMRTAGRRRGGGAQVPGERVVNETVHVGGRPDEMVETAVDLVPALNRDGRGHAILIAEHLDPPSSDSHRTVIRAWVQVSAIGLDAFVDDEEVLAWTTAIDNGAPVAGVEVELRSARATSDASGMAVLPLDRMTKSEPGLLIAREGNDVAILPEQEQWWGTGSRWLRQERNDSLRWYVFDDRHMYRPGETVHLKGWVRRFGAGEAGELGLAEGLHQVRYKVRDPRGQELAGGAVELNRLGGFDLAFDLPGAANLGRASVDLVALLRNGSSPEHDRTQLRHGFQIQEFRRPEFEVDVNVSPGPHFVGERATATVRAAYLAGGGLGNAPVAWRVATRPGSFVPPNRDDFTFGTWTPWWQRQPHIGGGAERRIDGRTDATGAHQVEIAFDRADPPRPTSVTAEAAVVDLNRQRWVASASLLVHPSSHYVGLRNERWFVERGEPIAVDTLVTNLDGTAVASRPVVVEAVHLRQHYEDGRWQTKEGKPQLCRETSGVEPVRCSFRAAHGGTYRLRARIQDEQGRPNQSELTVWVRGAELPPSREVEQEKVTLIPDREEYRPGDTAKILVQAPFARGFGLVTVRRAGILSRQQVRLETGSAVVKVPISEKHLPAVHLQVDVVGAAPRTGPGGSEDPILPARPAFAKGTLKLRVPARSRTLAVTVAPDNREVEPGGSTSVEVIVRDADGRPVAGSEVAVVVVDEAILALSAYELPDPIGSFYAELGAGGRDYHSRKNVVLANPRLLFEIAAEADRPMAQALRNMIGAAGGGSGVATQALHDGSLLETKSASSQPEPIRVRTQFEPLAVFSPENVTDARGRTRVAVTLPDNLTRYRVMAVAAAGERRFGKGEATITARLPLMVRPSPPRFLNFGDELELPVVVQNQTDAAMRVDVALRASNLRLTAGAGRRIEVAPRDRVEIRFPAAAALAGEARVQVGAVTETWTDAATTSFPVWSPAASEAFATYGEIDAGAVRQPVRVPASVVPEFGGLEITTSSTALQALTDAVLYLSEYPYECAEQVASRVLAMAALRDLLAAFAAEGLPPSEEIVAAMQRDIDRLVRLQNNNGGFGLWRRGGKSWPYVSAHVTHALLWARNNSYRVPEPVLERARGYLRDIESHVAGWPSERSRRTAIAYATHVLHRSGEKTTHAARRMIEEKGLAGLSLEAIGWLLPVLAGDARQVAAMRRYLENRVSETAAAANFVTQVQDGDYLTLRSSRRADAVILDALLVTRPRHDLIPKLVRGLLAHRVRGRWGNTQENVFVLLALHRYFTTFEQQTPDFVARAWLGEQFAGESAYRGRSSNRHRIDIPMRFLASDRDLLLQKQGTGRLYYRIGMRYAPASLELEPADHGFTVERSYEPIDDPGDVRRDQDGSWRVKAGARVRVRLRMVAPSRRYHVALVDPLPAGLEPRNPALAVTGDLPAEVEEKPPGRGPWWWWRRPWYEHQNLRDERVEAFASRLGDGVHTYTYVARATTPGRFVVPPAKAEEMYHPETFGRSGTDRLIVE